MTMIDAGLEVAMMEAGITAEELMTEHPIDEKIKMSFDDFMVMVLLADARSAG